MKTPNAMFRRTAISAALLAAFGTAVADDSDVKALGTPQSSVSVGVGNWSGDRPHTGIYDGMRDNGTYGLFDADVNKRNDATGTWLKFKALNLGLETREFRGDYERQGNYGGFLEYGKTIRENPYKINTGLQGIGTTNVTVGTNIGSFPTTDVQLGTSREMVRVGGFKDLTPNLQARLEFKSEDKKGTRQIGWGSAALFSVEPIDSNIQQLDAILQYTGEKLQLSGGYTGSWYDNHNTELQEHLNGVTGGTSASFNSLTPISQPLSNQAHQIFLDGGYGFSQTTRGSFKLAYTTAMQDEHIPTEDLGGANSPYVNSPSHLNGLIDTTLAQMAISSKPTPKLGLNASLRYYDVQDKTPLAGYVGNSATGVATVYNTPQSSTTKTGKLEANYRLPENFNLIGGIDYEAKNRSFPTVGTVYVPFRPDTTEVTYRAELKRNLSDNVNGSLAYLYSTRDGSGYTNADGTPYANQINPIYTADRRRDKVRGTLDWEPMDKLSLQFRAEMSEDHYPDNGRPYGLKDGNAQLYGIDTTYTFSEDWQFTAWYSRDVTSAKQVGFRAASSGAGDAIKTAQLKDVGDSLGMAVRGKLSSKIETGLGLDWFSTTSSYPQDVTLVGTGTTYPTGATGPVPDIRSDLWRLKFDTKYAIDKRSDLQFNVIYERWHTNDWTWNNADGSPFAYYSGTLSCSGCTGAGYTGVVDGTTVTAKQTQISTFVGLRYIYKF